MRIVGSDLRARTKGLPLAIEARRGARSHNAKLGNPHSWINRYETRVVYYAVMPVGRRLDAARVGQRDGDDFVGGYGCGGAAEQFSQDLGDGEAGGRRADERGGTRRCAPVTGSTMNGV